MSNLPYFSICIPTYNRIHSLELTISTVLAQTFGDYEIIVSDNASDPSAEALVKSFEDSRIRYFRHDSIIKDNWDFAIQKAHGEFLLLLADDDGLVPSALERVVELTTKSQARMIQVGYIRYAHPKPGTPIERKGNRILKSRYSGKVFCVDSLKVAKACLSAWGIGWEKEPLKISLDSHPSGAFMGTPEVRKVIKKCGRLTTTNCGDVGFLSALLQSKNLFFYDLPLAIVGVDISRGVRGPLPGRRRDYDTIAFTDQSVFHATTFTNLAVTAHLEMAMKNLNLLDSYDIHLRNSFYINHGVELLQDRIWDRRKIVDLMEWLQVVGKLPLERRCSIIFLTMFHTPKSIVISSLKQLLSYNWIDGREHGFSDIVSCALYIEKKLIPDLT